MSAYLIDSCVIIDHFRQSLKATATLEECSHKGTLHLSVLIIAEILAGTPVADETLVLDFLSNFKVHDIDQDIATVGAGYRRKFMRSNGISLADGIIAATAKKYNLVLVTHNKKHFPMDDIKRQFV